MYNIASPGLASRIEELGQENSLPKVQLAELLDVSYVIKITTVSTVSSTP